MVPPSSLSTTRAETPKPQGGFSYVYLVQDTSTSELYALKKIRCPFGAESVSQALKEVEAYTLFANVPNIIHSVDHAVQNDSGSKVSGIGDTGSEGSKTVYILLPYYRRGNLQDAINANLVNHTRFPEKRLMELMLGVAKALKGMHQYRMPQRSTTGGPAATAKGKARAVREEAVSADRDAAQRAGRSQRQKRREMIAEPPDAEDGEEGEAMPLMEGEVTRAQEGVAEGDLRGYAHRDIKPGKPPPSHKPSLTNPL
jgi:serine/threonine kinase 16